MYVKISQLILYFCEILNSLKCGDSRTMGKGDFEKDSLSIKDNVLALSPSFPFFNYVFVEAWKTIAIGMWRQRE